MGEAPAVEERSVLRDPRMYLVFSVTLIAVLGVSSIAPALPRIREALGVSPAQIGLLITAFTVPGVFLTPVLGILADRIGRRAVLAPALFLFALAGGACALARDFELLLLLRFLQGVGAAPIGALNLTLVGDLYAGRRRAAAMGYNSSVLSVGTASYPALGGALAMAGWWAPFLLAFAALPVGLAVLRVLPPGRPAEVQDLKTYLGGMVGAIRDRRVATVFVVSLVTFVLLYGAVLTYLPLLIHERFAGTSLGIGLIMAAMSLTTALASSRLGVLARRFRTAALMGTGFVLYAVALGAVSFVPRMTLLVLPAVVWGLGQGLNLPSAFTLLTDLVPAGQRAGLLALNGMVLRLGQTLGPLVAAAAFGPGGFEAVYLGGAALAALMALLLRAAFGSMTRR